MKSDIISVGPGRASENRNSFQSVTRQVGWGFRVLFFSLMSLLAALSSATAAPNVGGTVYREFKVNGQADAATSLRYGDLPLGGVTVSVYGEDGSSIGTTSSGADGTWSVDVQSAAGSKVLVEFGIPAGFRPGPMGEHNSSAVVIASKGANDIDFTVANPADHSEDDPDLVSSCFVTSTNPGEVTLVSVRYGDTKDYGTTLSGGPMDDNEYPQKHYATNRSLYPGAQKSVLSTLATSKNISGIAWNRRNKIIYGGVYHKWQIDVNIGQMGKIFATDISGTSPATSLWIDLNSYLGAGVTGTYTGSNSSAEKASVGYIGFTDVDISDDARTLFAFNAKTLQVYAIPVAEDGTAAVASAADIKAFQMPKPKSGTHLSGGQSLPNSAAGGLGFFDGRVYATVSVTGPTLADMKGVLYSFDYADDPASATVKKELEVDYSGWIGRDVVISGGLYGSGGVTTMGPWKSAHAVSDFSPWLFDVAFDVDDKGEVRMSLGTRNRAHEVIDPDELYIDPTRGGYLHRVSRSGSVWELEKNGSAGSLLTGLNQSGAIYGRSQEGARFYANEGLEGPMMHGTLAVIPGFKEAAGMATDNMFGDWDSGVSFHSLANGLRTRDNNIIYGASVGYAKGISWGDIEPITEAPPLQIGNYVWIDDGDGIQEAGESPAVGATVNIYADSNGNGKLDTSEGVTPVATTVTDSNGNYLFDIDDGLEYYTDYVITLNNSSDYSGGALTGFLPTAANAAASDNLDSDAVDQGSGFPEVAVRVGNFGETNHSYDFGFIRTVSVGNLVWIDLNGDGDVDAGEPGLPGATVSLCLADGVTPASNTSGQLVPSQTTNSDGSYLFSGLADGNYVIKVTPPVGFTPTTVSVDPDPDTTSTDGDSNGTGAGPTVQTPAFTLTQNGETPGDEDGDGDTYTDLTVDFGFTPTAVMIGNYVWIDADGEGDQDSGESGLSGAVVELFLSTGLPAVDTNGASVPFQTTGADGAYLFTGLPDGDYIVRVTPPANYSPTVTGVDPDPDTNNSDTDSNGVLQSNGKIESPVVMLIAGTESGGIGNNLEPSVDFGFVLQLFTVACASDANGGPVNPGDTIQYTISVTNTSGAELTGVSVDNPLPSGTTYVPNSITVTGGGGGAGSSTTFGDNFNTASYSRNDGASNWKGDWVENDPFGWPGPDDGGGDARYVGITGGRFQVNWAELNTERISRSADLTGYSSASLSFSWETIGLTGGQEFGVFASDSASGTFLELASYTGSTSGTTTNLAIPVGFIGADTTIRFSATGSAGWGSSDYGYIDNLVLTATAPPSGPTTGPPPNLVVGATIADGATMTVTFEVDVVSPNPGVSEIVSTTTIDSDQTTAPFTCSLTDLANQPGVSRDYADAPDTGAGTGSGNYNTLVTDSGPSHIIVANLKIGSELDDEAGILQNGTATADDADQSPDDEDGVSASDLAAVQATLPATVDVTVTNNTGSGAILYGWIDFDGDGAFEITERAFVSVPDATSAGTVTLDFGIVPSAAVSSTFARFRLSTDAAAADPIGAAADGEVEDYAVTILAAPLYDYGDLPDLATGATSGDYQTLLADSGARHIIVSGLQIGDDVDDELNGASSTGADADDGNRRDDEDGVVVSDLSFLEGFAADVRVNATNTTGTAAILYGFIDWNNNGSFADTNETVSIAVPDSSNDVEFTLSFGHVPIGATASPYSRFRLSTDSAAASASGTAANGEVEDYRSTVTVPAFDFGDAADTGGSTYDTLLASNGPRHVLGNDLVIGTTVDEDSDGQQSASADGDDNDGTDDEDGVSSPTLQELGSGLVSVIVTNPLSQDATLYGWIDFNDDGVLNNGTERSSVNVPQGTSGAVDLDFGTIAGSTAGTHLLRLRLSTDVAAADPIGGALDGEVEDHLLTITATTLDFGDAPDTGGSTYDTLLANNGPRHILANGLIIGAEVDAEADGAQSPTADGDDTAGSPDDEDGLTLSLMAQGGAFFSVAVENPLATDATLYGWIDFDGNGVFTDAGEITSVTVPGGTNGTVVLDFGAVPAAAVTDTFLRLRLSTDAAAANPTGLATDGEVEDHPVNIAPAVFDFADAPDSGAGTATGDYNTTDSDSGPSHVLSNGLKIGAGVDSETDGQPNATASGDDGAGTDDEDGLATALQFYEGLSASMTVSVVNPLAVDAILYGWVDFDGDGAFEAGEQATVSVPAGTNGTVELDFGAVPTGSATATFARLRISTDAAVASNPTGSAFDGEVEDHPVTIIVPQYDYADAPTASGYETEIADNGARHLLAGNDLFIGAEVDSESDGQPNATADGDDNAGSPDDEDGVSGVVILGEGTYGSVDVVVTNNSGTDAVMWAWIDFDGDGDFEISERIRTTVPTGTIAGTIALEFGVIPSGSAGNTFMRLRLTTDPSINGPSGAEGTAADGEVEDHPVTINPPQFDFGDADNSYGTLAASSGPGHILLGDDLVIGSIVDDESDGQPTVGADGDDATDDEDGVGSIDLKVGGSGLIPVTVANPTPSDATLFGWVDFDNSGAFEAGERASVTVTAGATPGTSVVLDFGTVPSGFIGTTTARFRISSHPGAGNPTGTVPGGEVEDHTLSISAATFDWADAPDGGAGSATGNYRTQMSDNGPNHTIVTGLMIGSLIDSESDGQQNAGAIGDDGAGSADEDGVMTSDLTLNIGNAADVRVNATNTTGVAATLYGWIDFNGDGIFDNATERASVPVATGSNDVQFTLAFGSVPSGSVAGTFARFRLSTDAAAADSVGAAADGEVEDYPVTITSTTVVDFGDAPNAAYGTLDASSGPKHTLGSDIQLGSLVDGESDGVPGIGADGDDSAGDADEDGVDTADLVLVHGDTAIVDVTATNNSGSAATLYGWIDFNGTGGFEASERASIAVPDGTTSGGFQLDFGVVGNGFSGTTYARFRLSTDGAAASPTSSATDGEIEDYVVTISAPPSFDWGDAEGYATQSGSNGPNHLLGSSIQIGAAVDGDSGSLQNLSATADDDDSTDDEDGIVTPSQLTLFDGQQNAKIDVAVQNTTGSAAILFGWIDFNGDGVFDNATERASANVPDTTIGNVTLTFASVPDSASTDTSGSSVLRLRLSSDTAGASSPTGGADDGEVEDHLVTLNADIGVGNLVFVDTNGNGHYDDGTDAPVNEVTVQLFHQGDDPSSATPVDSAETDTNGCYVLTTGTAGNYFVHIPAAEFGGSGQLNNRISITGNGGDTEADDSSDENGIDSADPATDGISSSVFALAVDSEPLGDGATGAENGKDGAGDPEDNDYDFTIDLGFIDATGKVGIGNLVFTDTNGDGDFDSGSEAGIDGVIVELFTAVSPPGVGSAIAGTLTANGGCYYFGGLDAGDYIVHIPGSEFGTGEPLANLYSSPGAGTDNMVDDHADENGLDNPNPSSGGISSTIIALATGLEAVSTGVSATETGKDHSSDGSAGDDDSDLTVDFGFVTDVLGIGNLVFHDVDSDGNFDAGDQGLDGVTVELYASANPPGSGSAIASTVTADGGCYLFAGLPPGGYVVHVPSGQFSSGGVLDGYISSAGAGNDELTDDVGLAGDENGIDPSGSEAADGVSTNVFTLAAGTMPVETGKGASSDDAFELNFNLTADLGFVIKSDTFAGFQRQYDSLLGVSNGPADNPDGDIYNNLTEYALCSNPGTGVQSHTPFCVELNSSTGKVEAFFTRREGSHSDISYTLETRDTFSGEGADSLEWFDGANMDSAAGLVTITNHGDGTETVKHSDLESISGMNLGEGYVRLRIDGTAGVVDGLSSYSQTFGWFERTYNSQCETASDPFLKKESFSGAIDSVDTGAGTLDIGTAVALGDITSVIDGTKHYYIEVVSGDHIGHRFEVDEASTLGGDGDTLYLSISGAEAEYNTAALGTLSDLALDTIVLREHRLLEDAFPVSAFTESDSSRDAGRLLFLNDSAGYDIYWLYDGSFDAPDTDDVRWVASSGALVDQGPLKVLRPCEGYFVHPQVGTVTLQSVGIVRENALVCPLKAGWNFVSNPWPVDRHPAPDQAGVAPDVSPSVSSLGLTVAAGCTGSTSSRTTDQLHLWRADEPANLGAEGFTSYFLLDGDLSSYGLGERSHWTSMSGSALSDDNGTMVLKKGKSLFLKMVTPIPDWTIPMP